MGYLGYRSSMGAKGSNTPCGKSPGAILSLYNTVTSYNANEISLTKNLKLACWFFHVDIATVVDMHLLSQKV